MSSLMDSIGNWITPELTSSLASRFGISTDSVTSALQTSSATMLTILANKVHDQTFLNSVHRLIAGSASFTVSSEASAPSFLNMLFGSRLGSVESAIAESENIPAPAAAAALLAAAPLVMGALANKVNAGGMSVAALSSALAAESPSLPGFLPPRFAIPGLIGSASSSSRAASYAAEESNASAGWLWPVLLFGALFILSLVWFFNHGNDAATKVGDTAAQTTTAVSDTATKVGNAAQNGTAALGAFFIRKLPNGVQLNIPRNGIENKLITFLEDPSKSAGKETWFDFDRLLFATGSASLQPSSTEQLQNIASILKAYPKVHLRIGGYTDNTGKAASNLKLSRGRASNVMAELVTMGVNRGRLDAKGYGREHPVANNATEAGRAKNRRISVRVTQK